MDVSATAALYDELEKIDVSSGLLQRWCGAAGTCGNVR